MLTAAQAVVVVAIALAYAIRARMLAKTADAVPRRRLICAALGVLALIASMLILRDRGRELLYWRTAEHLLIGDLGCLLLAIGLTEAMLAPLARTPARRLSVLARPAAALSLWVANLLVWQWPSFLDATLRHNWLALVQDVLLILASLNMWHALLSSMSARRPHMSHRGRIAYVLTSRLTGIALACVGIWSPDVYYTYFLHSDAAASTSPLADQGIAGAIMLGDMALIAIGVLLWMGARLDRPSPPAGHTQGEPAQTAGAGALAMDTQV